MTMTTSAAAISAGASGQRLVERAGLLLGVADGREDLRAARAARSRRCRRCSCRPRPRPCPAAVVCPHSDASVASMIGPRRAPAPAPCTGPPGGRARGARMPATAATRRARASIIAPPSTRRPTVGASPASGSVTCRRRTSPAGVRRLQRCDRDQQPAEPEPERQQHGGPWRPEVQVDGQGGRAGRERAEVTPG